MAIQGWRTLSTKGEGPRTIRRTATLAAGHGHSLVLDNCGFRHASAKAPFYWADTAVATRLETTIHATVAGTTSQAKSGPAALSHRSLQLSLRPTTKRDRQPRDPLWQGRGSRDSKGPPYSVRTTDLWHGTPERTRRELTCSHAQSAGDSCGHATLSSTFPQCFGTAIDLGQQA